VKVAVVTFPGSNCDEDAIHVARNVVGVEVAPVWHKDASLPKGTDVVILPGGFSYGDALRSGALARFSPIMKAVKAHADWGGYVLGICNGMQILVEAKLIEGAMLQNASQKFVCRWVKLAVENANTSFTNAYQKAQPLMIPVAHHEGRYFADPETLDRIEGEGRVVFRYVSGHNPNGSARDIAGIVNAKGNVLGMMPHPERASESILGSVDGLGVFQSLVKAVAR
jgi:phosphoribosylformylglycinamidine synthase subunit PurQ / glutaminase